MPAAAGILKEQALYLIIGRKGGVDGLISLLWNRLLNDNQEQ